jgi:hypothetical protein
MVISGAVSSQVSPCSSRHDRAARFKMHRTTSSARLMVVSLTPSRRRWALKGSSVASWICRSVRLPMNGNNAVMRSASQSMLALWARSIRYFSAASAKLRSIHASKSRRSKATPSLPMGMTISHGRMSRSNTRRPTPQ